MIRNEAELKLKHGSFIATTTDDTFLYVRLVYQDGFEEVIGAEEYDERYMCFNGPYLEEREEKKVQLSIFDLMEGEQ